ncbi:tyrosine-type recombinase/integrase [Chloroflexota bacterium]
MARLLNRLTVTELAELSGLSKPYISQVKHGKRPPSTRLIESLTESTRPDVDYLDLFIKSRQAMGASPRTVQYYLERLSKYVASVDYLRATQKDLERYLNTIPPNCNGLATRHASFRTMRTFHRWLNANYGLRNPMPGMSAPILGKPILPSLTREQVLALIDTTENPRDKAIIALFAESGLRLSELATIKAEDIDWQTRVVRVRGKGRKDAYAPFGDMSRDYLTAWLEQHSPNGSVWGMNSAGIAVMLKRLKAQTGIPCNPHTFRRTFACLLRKSGVDTMTIKDLGRWESLEMVQRYTRSVTFEDSLRFYRAPLQ